MDVRDDDEGKKNTPTKFIDSFINLLENNFSNNT